MISFLFTLPKFVYFLQVTDSAWDPDRAPELETMLAVIKRNFTLGVLIEEWVGPDDRNSQNHIIQIGTQFGPKMEEYCNKKMLDKFERGNIIASF